MEIAMRKGDEPFRRQVMAAMMQGRQGQIHDCGCMWYEHNHEYQFIRWRLCRCPRKCKTNRMRNLIGEPEPPQP
jgi:hypothetical protein